MKKLFTILMATVVAMSVYALPIKRMPAKHETEKQQLDLSALEKGHTAVPRTETAKTAPEMPSKKLAPQAKAVGQDYVYLFFDEMTQGPDYYEDTQSWEVGLSCYDESKPAYGHIIQLNWRAPKDDFTGTFTTEDFNLDYTWAVTVYSGLDYIRFDDIAMTVAYEDISANETKIVLKAKMSGSDGYGKFAFDVHAEKIVIKSSDSIVIPTVDAIIEEYVNGFSIVGSNDEVTLDLSVLTYEDVVGTFDLNQVDVQNSKIIYKGTEIVPVKLECTIGIKGKGAYWEYAGELFVIGSDFMEYTISFTASLPEPIDTVEISCVNLKTDWMDTRITFQASNLLYEIAGSWVANEIEPGTYSGADAYVSLSSKQTMNNYFTKATTIVVSGSHKDGWVLDINMMDDDNILYIMNLSWSVPTITDTILIAFDKSAKAMFYPDYNNDIQLYNENEQYYASLNVAGLLPGDSFTEDDLFPMYSGVEIVNENGEYVPLDYAFMQNGLLSQVEDTTKMYAEYITSDGKLYQVELWHAVPATPIAEMDVTYNNADFENAIVEGGYYSLIGFAADSLTAFKASIYAASEDEIAGTYVNDGMFGLFGEGQYEFAGADTYFDVYNPTTKQHRFIFADKGELTVSIDEDKNIILTGWIMGDDAVKYNLTMTSKLERPHLYYDTQDTPVDRLFTGKDKVIIKDYTPQWGPIYFEVMSEESLDLFNFELLVEEVDPEIVLPEGVYPITSIGDYNTVLAGTGVDPWSGQVAPGLYAAVTDVSGGSLASPLYFLVDGTVEVKNNNGSLYIEVNAVNSYDVPVHLVYDASATGVENIDVEKMAGTSKVIIDGQLYIIRDGKAFNAMGAQVK